MTNRLKSLEDYNAQASSLYAPLKTVPNGIACPLCGAECLDMASSMVIQTYPPQKPIQCSKCEWKGTRVC